MYCVISIRKVIKNEYVFSVISKVCTMLVGMTYSIIFARFVGAELKGTLAYIQSIVATGSIILSLGIHHAYPFFRKNAVNIDEYKKKYVSTSSFLFFIYGLFALFLPIWITQPLRTLAIFA